MKIFEYTEYICKLGENKHDNWNLLDIAYDKDYFFHLKSFPSSYVILHIYNDFLLTNEMLLNAATICKNSTKYRFLNDIKIDYCLCNNVSKGDNIGEAIFKSNRKVKQIKI